MTNSAPLAAWLELRAGHHFPRIAGHLTSAIQARQHAACDAPTGLFVDRIDPSLLGQDMVLMASRGGLPVDGRVHTMHRIRQRALLSLDEPYQVDGRVERRAAVPRGHEFDISAVAAGAPKADAAAVELVATYLLPGLAPSAEAGRASAPRPPDPASLAPLGRLDLTPERVKSYSADVGNLLHFDPAFAAARGFRAPIAQGLMLVTAFLGALARARGAAPGSFDLTARFRRPAFWDDRLEFRLGGERWCCIAADGRMLIEGEVTATDADG